MDKYCKTGKRKYLIKAQAQAICSKRNKQKLRNGRVYRCEKCNAYHVTKKEWKWPLDT